VGEDGEGCEVDRGLVESWMSPFGISGPVKRGRALHVKFRSPWLLHLHPVAGAGLSVSLVEMVDRLGSDGRYQESGPD
jgi:hypothetical protein